MIAGMGHADTTHPASPARVMALIRADGMGKAAMIGMHAVVAFAYACLGLWPIGLMLLGLALAHSAALVLLEPRLEALVERGSAASAQRRLLALRTVWNIGAPLIVTLALLIEPQPEVVLLSIFMLLGYFAVDLGRMNFGASGLHAYATGPIAGLGLSGIILIVESAARGGLEWLGLVLGYFLLAATVTLVWQASNTTIGKMRALRRKERDLIASLSAANAEAAATSERLKAVLEGGDTGAWEMDPISGASTPSAFLAQLLGKPLTYDSMRSGEALAMVVPDDRERVTAMYQRLHHAPAGAEIIEHAVFLADGSIGYVRTAGQSFEGSDGRIDKIALSTTNITARRRQEIELAGMVAQAEAALARCRDLLSALQARIDTTHTDEPDTDHRQATLDIDALRARLAGVLGEIDVRDLALTHAVETVRQAQQRAEDASLAKSQFLANMSHELRTPLNAIIGYSEIVGEDLAASGQTESLSDVERIHAAGKHLLNLIGEILDLSKIEAGRLDIQPEACDAAAIARQAIETVELMAVRQGSACELVVDVSDTTIVTDPGRLKQCLLNLLSNAAKFTEKGVITVTLRRLDLNDAQGLVIEVKDTGIGISADNLARLFQPFVQVDGSRSRRAGGAGIGLVITKRLAMLLGGDIHVASSPGIGSVFTLTVSNLAPDDESAWVAA